MNKLVIISVGLILVTLKYCCAQHDTIYGIFSVSYNHDDIKKTLTLYNDSTFDYKLKAGMSKYFSMGTWNKSGNSIILISDLTDFNSIKIEVEEVFDENIEGLDISIKNKEGPLFRFCLVIFNDDIDLQCQVGTSNDTCFFDTDIELLSLKVMHDNGVSKSYCIKNKLSNRFSIFLPIPQPLYQYLIFNKEEFRLKNDSLVSKEDVYYRTIH